MVDAADIRDHSEQLADRTVAELGRLDVWVNASAAPTRRPSRAERHPDDVFRSQLELNLTTVPGREAAAARMGPVASSSTSRRAPAPFDRTGPYAR
jgi:NAD(P)-dependent dehydrogenase (short-subunit alcohol dehydrogenase family)